MRPLLLTAVLLALTGSAWAQAPAPVRPVGTAAPAATPHHRRTLQERFDASNTAHDGHLTLEQARTGKMNAVVRDYAEIDTGRRGYVTMDDIKTHQQAVRAAKKAAKAG